MEFKPTLSSALAFAEADRIEEWVDIFLCGEGNNKGLSDGLRKGHYRFHAPKLMPLDAFKRCAGSEPDMKFHYPDEERFKKNITQMEEAYKNGGWDMPPIVSSDMKDGNQLLIDDGNHRYEALKNLGIKEYWFILRDWIG